MITPTTTPGSSPSATALSRAADRYEFKTVVLHGRTGSTYEARDRLDDCPVNIKLLSYSLTERPAREEFERRAKKLCAIHHPNLVPARDFGYHYGLAYLVSEELPGVTLEQYLRRRGPMPWRQFIAVFEGLLEALKEAHAHGLVHGDVQPSHVVLSFSGQWVTRVALDGFGFPDLANNAVSMIGDTRHVSTVSAIAPERVLRQACDHRLDLYALGATAYEMLSGRRPFAGASLERVFQSVYEPPPALKELVPPQSGVPEEMLELVSHLLEKAPKDRPPSAEQAQVWFHSAVGALPTDLASAAIPALTPSERVPQELSEDIVGARPRALGSVTDDASEVEERARAGAEKSRPKPASDPGKTYQLGSLPGWVSSASRSQTLSPALVLQVAGLFALFLGFVSFGWILAVNVTERSMPVERAPVAPPPEPPDPREEVQALFHQIDDALDEQRYGTAEDLIQRLSAREDFPPELRGTLKAYRSRLEVSSKLDRAQRLDDAGRTDEALILYWDLSKEYPNHPDVSESLKAFRSAFLLEVESEVKGVVVVDEEPVGVTPFRGLVPVTTKSVAVSRKGFKSWQTSVAAQPGTRLKLVAELEKRRRGERPDAMEVDLNASPFMDLMEMELQ